MENNNKIYPKKIYKKRLKPQVKIVIGLFGIVIFSLIASTYFFKYFKKPEYNTIYYSEQSDLHYKVYLKENNYFEKPFLEGGQQYIANLIDYIYFNFSYSFKSTTKRDYTYKYSIDATVSANEKGSPNKVLYSKTENLINEANGKIDNDDNFFINQVLSIDYTKYNNIINSFKKDYVLSLDSNLSLTLNITAQTKNSEGELITIKPSKPIKVVIPLSEQTINISIDYNKLNESNVTESLTNKTNTNLYLIIGIGSLILDFICLYIIITTIIKISENKTAYNKLLGRIMKEYDKVIVKIKNIPILDDYKIIQVENFDEMLDARDTLESNILYFEPIKNHKSIFLIINNDLAYIYFLSDDGDRYEKK